MSDDLGALADDLQAAILERLEAEGWSGRVTTRLAPEHMDILTLTIDAGPGPHAPGTVHGETLVPCEVLRDAPVVPLYLDMLLNAYRRRRRVNCYVGSVIEHYEPGHPNHGFSYKRYAGAWGNPFHALNATRIGWWRGLPTVVRLVDVDTHEEWYVRS